MKTLELVRHCKRLTVTLLPTYDMGNRSLVVDILAHNGSGWKPYERLTTNLTCSIGKNKAYVDTNNLGSNIIGWIVENDLGTATGTKRTSGYCQYPEVLFKEDTLRLFNSSRYEQYLAWYKGIEENKVVLFPTCIICKEIYPVAVTQEESEKYEEYVHSEKHTIQEVFPEMDDTTRALFAIGQKICKHCLREIFNGPAMGKPNSGSLENSIF